AITDATPWREYEFRCKPGDPLRRPCIIAPYQPRIDWQIWFAAMSVPERYPWTVHLIWKLLHNDPGALSLLANDPFPGSPPRFIRARYYLYQFAPPGDPGGAYWKRTLLGTWLPALAVDDPRRRRFRSRRARRPDGHLPAHDSSAIVLRLPPRLRLRRVAAPACRVGRNPGADPVPRRVRQPRSAVPYPERPPGGEPRRDTRHPIRDATGDHPVRRHHTLGHLPDGPVDRRKADGSVGRRRPGLRPALLSSVDRVPARRAVDDVLDPGAGGPPGRRPHLEAMPGDRAAPRAGGEHLAQVRAAAPRARHRGDRPADRLWQGGAVSGATAAAGVRFGLRLRSVGRSCRAGRLLRVAGSAAAVS